MAEVRQRKKGNDEKQEIAAKLKKRTKKDEKSSTVWLMSGILLSFVVLAGFFWNKEPKEITVAKFNEDGEFFQEVQCSPEHAKKDQVPECTPKKCGRLILDGLLNQREIEILKNLASSGTMALGGGAGGASILELSGSTCSMGENFGSLFKIRENAQSSGDADTVSKIESIYSEENLSTYYAAKEKVKMAIATAFGVDEDLLGLASPTFFSRITGNPAKTPHDEYWHSHIDSNQYPSFDYTALIYLNDQYLDFSGGRFIFEASEVGKLSQTQYVEPRAGRLGAFTSGSENPHRVEKVSTGERYAFTMGFTCNPAFKIPLPKLP